MEVPIELDIAEFPIFCSIADYIVEFSEVLCYNGICNSNGGGSDLHWYVIYLWTWW